MTPTALTRLFLAYGVLLLALWFGVRSWVSLRPPGTPTAVLTGWKEGQRVQREIRDDAHGTRAKAAPGVHVVAETVTGEGPLLMQSDYFLFALVPGRDGVMAEIDGKTAYATADDLVASQAYDRALSLADGNIGLGTHVAVPLHLLSQQLGVSALELKARGRFRRVSFEREGKPPRITPAILGGSEGEAIVLDAVRETARHLARSVDAEGRFRYLVDANTNRLLPGYNWPRHSGATYFLAQAADLLDDAEVRYACLRAAARLRDDMMKSCGDHRCIAEDDFVEIGSSALALIAFSEIVRTNADPSYRPAIVALAAFLRSQQREDGELKHVYRRAERKAVDVQYLYFTGEAALALSRAHRITGDERDLDAARRALARLSGSGWSFFGSRYYFSEEHWTCQAVADLWDRAPDEAALGFCARWHEFQRRLQHDADDQDPDGAPYDSEGSFGIGPIVSPRVTPASSRGEAAVALLDVLRRSGRSEEGARVDLELRRALAFVLRSQFRPGPTHLFADPDSIRGALPGSPVDWQLRIDYAQHAGSMMVRWLELKTHEKRRGAAPP